GDWTIPSLSSFAIRQDDDDLGWFPWHRPTCHLTGGKSFCRAVPLPSAATHLCSVNQNSQREPRSESIRGLAFRGLSTTGAACSINRPEVSASCLASALPA